ncbi:hypothetical protein [Methanobacterium oryzae]
MKIKSLTIKKCEKLKDKVKIAFKDDANILVGLMEREITSLDIITVV